MKALIRPAADLWRNLNLCAKLATLGVVLCAIALAGLLVFAHTYSPITEQSQSEAKATVAANATAQAFEQWTLDDDQSNMYVALVALRDPSQKTLAQATLQQALDARKAVDPQLALIEGAVADSESRALVASIRQDLTAYDAFTARMQSAAQSGVVNAAVRAVTVDNSNVSDDTTKAFVGLEKRTAELASAANASIDRVVDLGRQRMIEIAVTLVLLTAICLYFVGRSIIIPLSLLTAAAGKLALGNVEVEDSLPIPSKDELGVLSASFREMVDHQKSVAQAAEAIAAGDLRLRAVSRGENDRLGHAFEAMLKDLRTIISGVAQASDSLVSASEHTSTAFEQSTASVGQIAAAVDLVASGAAEQSAQIADTATAVEELSRTAEQIASVAADQANSISSSMLAIAALDESIGALSAQGDTLTSSAREATTEATTGTTAVMETAGTMTNLKEVSAAATTAMAALEERSTQVGEIVDTIEDIADQTNLLALNAAIEAARAGDAGRGFAVVADEVRKLADRSRTATADISKILGAMKSDTRVAAETMRASVASMDSGINVSQRASRALQTVSSAIVTTANVAELLAEQTHDMRVASRQVAENMTSTSAAVEENSAAAQEMRSTTDHVTNVIVPISATASRNAQTAQQASAATQQLAMELSEIESTARSLRDQAASLSSLVGRFTLDDEEAPRAAAARRAASPRRAADPAPKASYTPSPTITENRPTMFDWDDKYTVGNDLIDTEHKKLFKYAANLHTAMLERRGPAVVAKLLSALADYTAEHFADEEALQRATHYPDLKNHLAIHKGFVDKLAALQRDLAEGKSSVSMQLMDFLKKWLAQHIGKEDQKVAAHVRSQGAKAF